MSINQQDDCQSQSSGSSDEQSPFCQSMKLLTEQCFNKEFTYPEIKCQELTEPVILFSGSRWKDPVLQGLKKELNERKSELSDLDIEKWHNHTSRTHPGGLIMKNMRKHFSAEMCTKAWCKFREIVHRLDLTQHLQDHQLRSVHLCEAPGAFVTSFNHYLRNKGFRNYWIWLGMTLNPYYEGNSCTSMIDDDQFINKTLEHWYFGVDNTGDIININNVIGLNKICQDMGGVHLVTADGSIDCANDPGEQESMTSALHYCELTAALQVLQPGGHFVLKMFTMFEDNSVALMFILRSCFDKLTVLKPVTSKPGNSELYIVAQGFKGLPDVFLQALLTHIDSVQDDTKAIFPADVITDSFMECHRKCCQMFTKYQMDAISQNLQLFENNDKFDDVIRVKMLREGCKAEYVTRYEISPLDKQDWIVPVQGKNHPSSHTNHSLMHKHTGSFVARQQKLNLDWNERLQQASLFTDDLPTSLPWLQCNSHPSKEALKSWFPIRGKAFSQINSSRFCDMKLLQMYNDVLTYSKYLQRDVSPDDAYDLFHENSLEMAMTLFDDNTEVISINNTDTISSVSCRQESQSSSDTTTMNPDTQRLLEVNCYSPCIREQSWLVDVHPLCIFLHLLNSKMLKQRDCFLITVPPPVTRISAALLYICGQCFRKVTMVIPKEAAFPVCYLVAVGYRSCTEYFISYLTTIETCNHGNSVDVRACTEQSRTDDKLLEIVPFYCFHNQRLFRVLKGCNETYLKKRINFFMSEERKLLQTEKK